VQLDVTNVPPPEVVKLTEPVGGVAPAGDVSVTVAVQDVLPPWLSWPGEQATLVLVRARTLNAALLPAVSVSPLVRVALMMTPVSGFVYVTPLIVI
jgi:hypothetical protein